MPTDAAVALPPTGCGSTSPTFTGLNIPESCATRSAIMAFKRSSNSLLVFVSSLQYPDPAKRFRFRGQDILSLYHTSNVLYAVIYRFKGIVQQKNISRIYIVALAQMANQKYLVTFEIQEGERFTLRSVLTTNPVTEEDAIFYYHYLLGFQNFVVKIHNQLVPESFTVSLLGASISDIPLHFPAYDLETDHTGVQKYFTLLERVCEMENLRVEYGIGAISVGVSSGASSENQESSQKTKYKSWVEEVLKAIHTSTMEAASIHLSDQNRTFAWMVTPVLKEVRDIRGSRVITDETIGKEWASRLGTEVFPDLVISRRFSTIDWKFQHPSSDTLAKQAIHWYLEAQMLGTSARAGISPWILEADEELAAVLTPFKRLGLRQHFTHVNPDKSNKDKLNPITEVIQRLEGDHILSGLTHEGVMILTANIWERYIRHIFRAYSVATTIVDSCWGSVQETIQIWCRGSMGIRVDQPALVSIWQIWWEALVVPKPTQERFDLFLSTLDLHDPIMNLNLSTTQKYAIGAGWIKVCVETEFEPDSTTRIPTSLIYTSIRDWCIKYVPTVLLDNSFKPQHIGPVLTTLGYLCHRTKKGRAIVGLRYKQQAVDPSEQASAALAPSVLSYFSDVPKPDGLAIMAKDEIHLGSV